MKKVLYAILGIVLVIVAVVITFYFVYLAPFMNTMEITTTVPYDKQLTIILGGGGNTGVLVGDSAVLVIDTKQDKAADSLAQMVKALAGNKPIIVVNTHIHPDHTKGNKFYQGQTIIAGGNYNKDTWVKANGNESLPTVWVKDSLIIPFGDDTAVIVNLPWNAHTESDVVVYLRKRKILFCGDVVLNGQAPVILSMNHSDGYGYMKAFDYLQARFAIDKVVPGHGNIGGPEVINNFRTYFNDMKTAAAEPTKRKELIDKYKDWRQIPFVMSPSASEKWFEKHGGS